MQLYLYSHGVHVLVDHRIFLFFASHSLSLAKMFTPSEEEFVMVASTPIKRPQSMMFFQGASRPPPAVNLHRQTGNASSMVGVVYPIT